MKKRKETVSYSVSEQKNIRRHKTAVLDLMKSQDQHVHNLTPETVTKLSRCHDTIGSVQLELGSQFVRILAPFLFPHFLCSALMYIQQNSRYLFVLSSIKKYNWPKYIINSHAAKKVFSDLANYSMPTLLVFTFSNMFNGCIYYSFIAQLILYVLQGLPRDFLLHCQDGSLVAEARIGIPTLHIRLMTRPRLRGDHFSFSVVSAIS